MWSGVVNILSGEGWDTNKLLLGSTPILYSDYKLCAAVQGT